MHIHKWKGVPLFGGDVTADNSNRVPEPEDFGYLRLCETCGLRQVKDMIHITVPCVALEKDHTHFAIVFSTKQVPLFKMWLNHGYGSKNVQKI